MQDLIILPSADLKNHRWARYPKNRFNVVIGGVIYVPYQLHYDRKLKEYVWKFKRT